MGFFHHDDKTADSAVPEAPPAPARGSHDIAAVAEKLVQIELEILRFLGPRQGSIPALMADLRRMLG
jgi:hypothetical protein